MHILSFEVQIVFLQLPNFNLQNMILTYTKDLSWKNWPNLSLDFKEKIQITIFLISSCS
jgi:hypothetical protein